MQVQSLHSTSPRIGQVLAAMSRGGDGAAGTLGSGPGNLCFIFYRQHQSKPEYAPVHRHLDRGSRIVAVHYLVRADRRLEQGPELRFAELGSLR
jgi:hypothetical protein